MQPPPLPASRNRIDRRNAVTLKLLFIAALVLGLQVPLRLVNGLRQERLDNHLRGAGVSAVSQLVTPREPAPGVYEGYRMVERSLKHGVLVLSLVFAAFFLFEILAQLRLHAVHYTLVGAALSLFYLALLALGEVASPGYAYIGAAATSSGLIALYSAAILRSWVRASIIAALLAAVHSVLFVVLRMEAYALLAGTGALFIALAAIMYFTRNIDWSAQELGPAPGSPATPGLAP